MDVEISEMLKILNDYEGNEKEIFELIQAEAMVKYKQCEEMIDTILNNKFRTEKEKHEAIMSMIGHIFTCGVSYGSVQVPLEMIKNRQSSIH
ncbi:hypothetical protein CN923_15455 [Bacillus cereus]|uniref:hypothetical protein n=1 Tax=Bacillus nitratireducens TaxID=2026193 RepID=UPI0005CCA232|nr:hypothetical protein [Bacillus nitratireducens]PEA27208.1 hypothetical protein CON44_10995 [Bacillus cereus]PEQ42971.1 hypothetical protein CN467_03890 [Bacillus cereus]PER33763.1 hypothetical protein CN485_10790 [Bacillus cereus]PEW96348.1 hypothetical protein CN446_17470 [Bacillus cereus]PEX97394.1 hypothetical protein CN465_04055 [Bacillus cereus]